MNTHPSILIAGAGEAGRMLLLEYVKRGKSNLVAGFVDDDAAKRGLVAHGKRVLGGTDAIGALIKEMRIGQIIVAMPSASPAAVKRIVSLAITANPGVSIHILPEAEKFFDTVPLSPALQDIQFTELFDRDEFNVDIDAIRGEFAGSTVLVTGAGGSIGMEICRQLLKFGVGRIVALGRGEHSIYTLAKTLGEYLALMDNPPDVAYRITDVRHERSLACAFERFRPDIVFHAAAHKHVPLMEFNEAEALANNVGGTRNALELSAAFGAHRFVLVSTDKAVRPANVMGATKRMAELVTGYYGRERGLPSAIVRFGNVIGSRGSVIPLFREQIERGGPVTVTHPEVTRYFMSIPEAALLVINASAYSRGGEIFVLDMGRPYRLADVARRLIGLYGYEPDRDIRIEYTGLRPGEKLYEELFYDRQSLARTANEKIMVLGSDSRALTPVEYRAMMEEFLPESLAMDRRAIREKIRAFVPEYEFNAGELDDEKAKGKLVN